MAPAGRKPHGVTEYLPQMKEMERRDAARLTRGVLSSGELATRRVAWRRRRRRRRVALLAGIVLLLAAAFALARGATGGGGAGAPRSAAARSAPSRGPSPPARSPARLPRAVRHRGANQARPVHRVLAYTSYVQLAGHRRRDVALTFDDGPGQYTHSILNILKRTHTPATFFVIGEWARAYPQLVAAEVRDGFEVGDHTETHAYLSELPPLAQARQISDAASAIRRAGAPAPVLFRPPYGAFTGSTLSILHQLRLLMVLWSVDTSDYARPGVAKIIYTALSGARPGAIILMHDGGGDRAETVAALPRIIRRLRARGFHLVTISQLVANDPPPASQPTPRSLSGIG